MLNASVHENPENLAIKTNLPQVDNLKELDSIDVESSTSFPMKRSKKMLRVKTEDAEKMCSFSSINVSTVLTIQYCWPLNTWQCRWTVLATIDMIYE